jgi:hypothetical protein
VDRRLEGRRAEDTLLLDVIADRPQVVVANGKAYEFTVRLMSFDLVATQIEIVGWRDDGVRLAKCVAGIDRPSIVSWSRHHRCTHGIHLAVAVAREQITIAVDEAGLEVAFLQGAGAMMARIEIAM